MKKHDKYYSPMPGTMAAICVIGLVGCGVFGGLYAADGAGWMYTCAISFGMVAYHMLIRFLSPVILLAVFRRKYDCRWWWFRPRRWEAGLYRRLNVQGWKAGIPSWDPSQFSLEEHSLQEIAVNMCHAEAVHELIVVLSFTSLLFAIPFGALAAFLITAVLAALVDCVFIVLQRYNRPRITAILDRRAQRAAR